MAKTAQGPDVGESIAHLKVLNDQGDETTLGEIQGNMLVVDVFRGHW
jgi:hypothetical protein